MPNTFADLHCHPVHLNFNEFQANHTSSSKTPWDISKSKLKKLKKAKRTGYTQADVAKMIEGGVRLVFVALYPIEQGYFQSQVLKDINDDVLDNLEEDDDLNPTDSIIDIKTQALFVKLSTGLSAKRVRQIQRNSEYNYNNEFVDEKLFWLKSSGQLLSTKNGITLNATGNPERIEITGRYFLLGNDPSNTMQKTISDIQHNLLDQDLVVVFTLEGTHSLTRKNHDISQNIFNEQEILTNVETLKNEQVPIFFITLAHHFDNGISAHAHSLPTLPFPIPPFDQETNMNKLVNGEGISDLGKKVIHKLLNLNANGDDVEPVGKRILIDVKHMSAVSRKEYYEIIKKFNQLNPTSKIPIIASHVAYSGARGLDELILEMPNESNTSFKNNFLNWNINICDEDIIEIVASEGLIGLVFEQRVLGVPFHPLTPNVDLNKPEFQSREVFKRHITAIIDAAKSINLHQFDSDIHTIWNTICIGSDFDGGIDPIQSYPTALHFGLFRDDLRQILSSFNDCNIDNNNIDDVLDLICFKNCHKFLIKHFPRE